MLLPTVPDPYLTTDHLPCLDEDPDLFFAEAPADLEVAKEVCATCPVRESCLTGALDRREPYGVWGGQLLIQGVIVARKRPRGRPRKDSQDTAPRGQVAAA